MGSPLNNEKGMLAIIPFYSKGNSNSKIDNRIEYLHKTLATLNDFNVKIFVNNQDDFDLCSKLSNTIMLVGSVPEYLSLPEYLPISSCKYLQQSDIDYDYIYFTEADQELFWNKNLVINFASTGKVVTPNRLEELPDSAGINYCYKGKQEYDPIYYRSIVVFNNKNNKKYIVANRTDYDQPGDFYKTYRNGSSYGGAFFCTKEIFNSADFRIFGEFPLESTSFSIFRLNVTYKSTRVQDFYVNHLSGKELHNDIHN